MIPFPKIIHQILYSYILVHKRIVCRKTKEARGILPVFVAPGEWKGGECMLLAMLQPAELLGLGNARTQGFHVHSGQPKVQWYLWQVGTEECEVQSEM